MAAPRLHLTPSDGEGFWIILADWRNWRWTRPLDENQQRYMRKMFLEHLGRHYRAPRSSLWLYLLPTGMQSFITRFPPEFYELTEIGGLLLPIDKESQFDPTGFTQLTHLHLEVSGFEEVPVYDVPTLRSYIVYGDEIRTVPAAISSMNLTSLTLSGNAIEKLPPEIGDMRSLHELYLSETNIRTLPKEMINLTDLRFLNLSWSKIKRIPIDLMRAFHRMMLAGQLRVRIYDTPLFKEYRYSGVANSDSRGGIPPEFLAFLILQREDELARARAFVFVNEQLAAPQEGGEVGMPRPAPERVEDATRRRLAGGGADAGADAGAGAGAGAADAPPPPPALVRDVQRRLLTDAFALGRRHKAMLEMFD